MRRALGLLAFLAPLAAPAAEEGAVDFRTEVAPLLRERCGECHMGRRHRGGLSLNTRESLLQGGESGPAAVPGKSDASAILRRVSAADPDERMPSKGDPLGAEEVARIQRWIDAGLTWDPGIDFGGSSRQGTVMPRRVELPAGEEGANPVDRLLAPYFAGHGIEPPPPAGDRVFIRRAFLDLAGLLPPREALAEFVRDESPAKRERLVRDLLADRDAYASHWLPFWNDALRNAYRGTGFIDGGRSQITEWLYRSLHENVPYDRFVRELIDPVPGSEGFTGGIRWRGVVNESQRPEIQAAQNIAQVFLGTNLKCASCHDSFVNDWTLEDAYGLAAVFAEERLELHRCDKPTGEMAAVRFIYPELGSIDGDLPRRERVRRLAEIVTRPENGRLARTAVNRLWARLFSRGIVEPVDDLDAEPWHCDLLDWLASDLIEHGWDLKRTLALLATSRAYALPSVDGGAGAGADGAYVFRGPAVRRMAAEEFADAVATVTGVRPRASDEMLSRDGRGQGGQVAAVARVRAAAAGEHVAPGSEAARWIWADSGALAAPGGMKAYLRRELELAAVPAEARLVAAADNGFELWVNGERALFGESWEAPVAADIAARLRAGRNVFAVEATNAGSDPSPAGFLCVLVARDTSGEPLWHLVSDGLWLAHDAPEDGWREAGHDTRGWRHAAVAGGLDAKPWKIRDRLPGAVEVPESVRAALAFADPLLVALGVPNREQVVTRRDSAATLLQALELTNGATLDGILARGAARWLELKLDSPVQLVEEIFEAALGRAPVPDELAVLADLAGSPPRQEGVEDVLWIVFMLPEFQLIP